MRLILSVLMAGAAASALGSGNDFEVTHGTTAAAWQHRGEAESEPANAQRPEEITPVPWRLMIEGIETDSYAVRIPGRSADAPSYVTYNRAHGLRASFAQSGARVRSTRDGEEGWEWALRLERFGYEGSLAPVNEVAPTAEGNRVEYRRGVLTEWYVNDPEGLEQGFTVPAPPTGGSTKTAPKATAPLVLELRSAGLETRHGGSGESILLAAYAGDAVIHYRGLVAWDAEGTYLPARMRPTADGIRIEVADRGAAYPLTIDPFIESAALRAFDTQAYDRFGGSVAVSGDTAVVSAFEEDGGPGDPLPGVGAVYIFERRRRGTGAWAQVRKLAASDAQAADRFGASVAISGDTVVVGAFHEDGGPGDPLRDTGTAYIFERDAGGPGNWGEVAKLTASDAHASDHFGDAVAISGDTVIVGASDEDGGAGSPIPGAGAAYIFERNAGGLGSWGEVAKLTASDAQGNDYFGEEVGISGDTAIVGARWEDGGVGDPLAAAGAAYVFERNQGGPGNWGQVAKLASSDSQPADYFGNSVGISGGTAIVGARWEDAGPGDPIPYAGAAYVFERHHGGASNWGEVTKLTASDAGTSDYFGWSVAISGDTILVGAIGKAAGSQGPLPSAGAAYVFERLQGDAHEWGEVTQLTASDAQAEDLFGWSVAVSDRMAIVGAVNESGGPGDLHPGAGAGAAYAFEHSPWAFVLSGDGHLYAAGAGVPPISPQPRNFGFDAARDVELSRNGAYVLDGFGGVHAAGGEAPLTPGPPYFGWDIAQDLELAVGGGGYALDGFGAVHAVGGAPVLMPPTPYFGFDVARDLELGVDGYYVLDGYGGLHAGAGAEPISPGPPYFGFDVAKDLELAPGGGYVLDGYGGVHALGTTSVPTPATPYFGFDIARDLELARGGGYYVLDGFGGVHAAGGATAISPAPPYFGVDLARDLEIR